jgi:hypothetical protein
MVGVAGFSRVEAGDDVGLRVAVVILASRRQRSRGERVAEVVLSSLTVLLGGFLFVCLRHAVQLSPIQFLP